MCVCVRVCVCIKPQATQQIYTRKKSIVPISIQYYLYWWHDKYYAYKIVHCVPRIFSVIEFNLTDFQFRNCKRIYFNSFISSNKIFFHHFVSFHFIVIKSFDSSKKFGGKQWNQMIYYVFILDEKNCLISKGKKWKKTNSIQSSENLFHLPSKRSINKKYEEFSCFLFLHNHVTFDQNQMQ